MVKLCLYSSGGPVENEYSNNDNTDNGDGMLTHKMQVFSQPHDQKETRHLSTFSQLQAKLSRGQNIEESLSVFLSWTTAKSGENRTTLFPFKDAICS